jgi:hypothetical protein
VTRYDYAVPDREPEPWESSAAGPFLTLERARGSVEMWAPGGDRFSIRAPGHEQVVVGFEAAQQTADKLAEQLE